MRARAGADIHNVIRRAHGIFIVLDDDERIAQIAQVFQRGKQLFIVALVQANGRLIQNIQYAHQAGTNLRGQANALRFAAGQRSRRARQRQII